MRYGRSNILAGVFAIFAAAAGGMALGFTMESFFPHGFYEMPFARALLKAGHTHGMPLALYNLVVGSMIDRLALDDAWKKRGSVLAMVALIMPVGLALRGAAGGATAFVPVVMTGALGFLASAAVLLKGALALDRTPPDER